MATPTAAVKSTQEAKQAELQEELRQAEADFARGDFIELTIEQAHARAASSAVTSPTMSRSEISFSTVVFVATNDSRTR